MGDFFRVYVCFFPTLTQWPASLALAPAPRPVRPPMVWKLDRGEGRDGEFSNQVAESGRRKSLEGKREENWEEKEEEEE